MAANDPVLNHNRKPGIYIHIPFCLKKCNYCSFLSYPAYDSEREHYIDGLVREIRLRKNEVKEADTIYLGGGTPSILKPVQLERILDEVRRNFNISDGAEVTIEANPSTLTKEKLRSFRSMGVNRLSIGVQSMNDDRLRYLGRTHSRLDVVREYELARRLGFDNISMDLIFSIPGTTMDDALEDLDEVIDLAPDHISFYSLQLEEGTRFFHDFEMGMLQEVSDEEDRETFREGCLMLRMNGYEHYEISNFGTPGHWSRHNHKYWSMVPYVGLGLGASSFTGGRRTVNVCNRKIYADLVRSGSLPFETIHVNSERDNISEAVWTGLRRVEGVRYEDVLGSREAFEEYYSDVWDEVMEFAMRGFLAMSDEAMLLTERGIDISNKIMALFV